MSPSDPGFVPSRLRRLRPDRECSIDSLDRPFGIGTMLSRSGPPARVMRNFDQWQLRNAEEFRFGPAKLHEDRLAKRDRRLSALLQFNGVVDTPRRAGASRA